MTHNPKSEIDWNEYATDYDALLKLRPYTHMLEEVVGAIDLGCALSVLDAGCGTGNLLKRLEACRIPKIIGTDSSGEMLARAKGKSPGITLIQAGLNERLPFGDREFGAIACVNVLYAVEDPESTLTEFARLTAQNGMLVIVTPKKDYDNGLILKAHCESQKQDEYWKGLHADPVREETLMREALQDEETFFQMRRVVDINRRISQNAQFHFFTKDELQAVVHNAGFRIVDHRETYARQSHLLVARLA